jgi:putative membrane protein
MTSWQLLTTTWHWHPSILLGCAALLLGHAAALRFRLRRESWWFAAGVVVLLVALLSPLHVLGDDYLFSAHMAQHLLLMLIVPPLLLWGVPAALADRMLRGRLIESIGHALGRPLIAWWIGIGTMWLWHLPLLYNAALDSEAIHIVEHLCFLVSSIIFWWPISSPIQQSRLAPLPAMAYIFAGMAASTILGILLTFVEPGLYPAYLSPRDSLGILPLLRDGWGLTPPVDQQLGGLLMWIPGNAVYFAAFLGMLARWYATSDDDHEPPIRSTQHKATER